MKGEFIENHPLARYTSWRIGGPADRFYRPADLADLHHFLKQLPPAEPVTWLGLGSNVLIRDKGIRGTVILTLNRLKHITELQNNSVRVEAGVTCAKLSKFCIEKGYENGAFFAGIPGTIGGALTMNAGAFGGETWQVVTTVEVLTRQGELLTKTPNDFEINYRQVKGLNGDYFVAAIFRFEKGDLSVVKQKIKALMQKRNESQPIGSYSCGSVFRNPPNDFAARLIEAAGLKGRRIGDAEISVKHANFILNLGAATASDIENLMCEIQRTVLEKFHVKLVPEVHIVGEK